MKKLLFGLSIFVTSICFGQTEAQQIFKGTASGTDSYTVTISNMTYPTLLDGKKICVSFTNPNTGASTLTVINGNGISYGAKSIYLNGSATVSGDISNTVPLDLTYTSSTSKWNLTKSSTGGGTLTDAAADGVTKGKAAFTAADFNSSSGVISIDYANGQAATGAQDGFLQSADWTTFNNKFTLPALTSGSVLFSDGSTIAQDNSNLFWNNTDNRLGVGTASPASPLDVVSSGNLNTLNITHSGTGVGIYTNRSSNAVYSGSQYATAATLKWILGPRGDGTEDFYMYNYTISKPIMLWQASSGFLSVGYDAPTPTAALHVKGSGATTASYWFKGDNSAGTAMLHGRDDGYLYAGNATTKSLIFGQNSSASMALSGNTFIGVDCGKTGNFNTAIGYGALVNSTGDQSTAVGSGALQNATAGYNVGIGKNALVGTTTGSGNVAIGNEAGTAMTGATFNVFVGYQAGYYETGSSKLFIDNASRASEADARVKALIYGIFSSAATSQELHFNSGIVDINGRLETKQGTDVASSSTITLTYTGNSFELTGTTAVNFITTTGWQEGSEITLIANENVTLNDDAGGGNLRLAGNANVNLTADDVITFIYSSTTAGGVIWREKSRSVN